MTPESLTPEDRENEALRTLVTRATADIGSTDESTLFADDATREAITSAYETAVSDSEVAVDDVQRVVDEVLDQLSGARLTLQHQSRPSFDAAQAMTYSFIQTGDETYLTRGPFDGPVCDRLERGAREWSDGDYGRAAESFEAAADAASEPSEVVASHVLAAAAEHRSGADESALDHIRSALEVDTDAWTPLVVGIASASDVPKRFRDGNYRAGLYVRWTDAVPENCRVEAEWRPTPSDPWEPLPSSDCSPLSAVTPETELRFTLSGSASAFPELLGYYVAVGAIAEGQSPDALSSDRLCFSGPVAENVAETLSIDR
ncbi:hypothetical protein C453_11546 [Haloferax elongans ATCC BAA-1513]|uniref:Uncharacterized protein n=1 Tax=Haloferax elongans ATCC BAA-1513 TaxID=1230453 RepID=M0HJI6_HALEO|nr:tetratricopeptide repeat protein [Haloferax elongans]ELZ84646.1 hypothetical protein C453_11546 [Haloferax elongans ATCC BAA-1513]